MKQIFLLGICACAITPINAGYQAEEFKKLNIPIGSIEQILQTSGAKLHPNCLQDFNRPTVTHRGGAGFLNSLLQTVSKPGGSEAIIPSTDPVQNTGVIGADGLEQLLKVFVVLHNSQAFHLQDQQETLKKIEKNPSIGGETLLKIDNQVERIREQQASWIPSTTRELLSTTRTGAGSIVTVVSIVGLLILAKYFGFL